MSYGNEPGTLREQLLIDTFKNGLRADVKYHVGFLPPAKDYEEAISQAARIEQNIQSNQDYWPAEDGGVYMMSPLTDRESSWLNPYPVMPADQ